MEQPTLFNTGTPPAPTPLDRRNEAREAAYDAADEAWRDAYTRHILKYLVDHRDATAEEIREAYRGPQTPNSQRASGGIFIRLRRAGRIRMNGSRRSKLYGNFLTTYELVI